jgi:hypothetical protein
MADLEALCAFVELRVDELPMLPADDARTVKGLVRAYHEGRQTALTEHTLREVGAVFSRHVDYRREWAPDAWA